MARRSAVPFEILVSLNIHVPRRTNTLVILQFSLLKLLTTGLKHIVTDLSLDILLKSQTAFNFLIDCDMLIMTRKPLYPESLLNNYRGSARQDNHLSSSILWTELNCKHGFYIVCDCFCSQTSIFRRQISVPMGKVLENKPVLRF